MHALKKVLVGILRLFVDDGVFAGAIVLWLAFACGVLPGLEGARTWGAGVLFSGLAVILISSALRRARH